ncbi:YcaO-like family protein [Nonomuraea salmonea]|uniref:YcaO-like family protein n=1 Tax=Nonomuraea salmonea TaxID=46181 RepID=UPI0036106742
MLISDAKVRLPGTDRARDPAATLTMARRAARAVGVTRVADITRLDTVGIPTFQAIRPASRTLAVSQGKGVTPDLARLSAIMESIELWHVEQSLPPDVTAPRANAGSATTSTPSSPPRRACCTTACRWTGWRARRWRTARPRWCRATPWR